MKKKDILIILSVVLLIVIDQITKVLISSYITNYKEIILIPKFLSFTYVKNYGAAFGMLEGKRVFFIILTVVALTYLIYELIKNKDKKYYLISFILIISGIVGNFIDRVFFGYVRDFISFRIFDPVFNMADSFIVVGAVIFIFYELVGDKNGSKRRMGK